MHLGADFGSFHGENSWAMLVRSLPSMGRGVPCCRLHDGQRTPGDLVSHYVRAWRVILFGPYRLHDSNGAVLGCILESGIDEAGFCFCESKTCDSKLQGSKVEGSEAEALGASTRVSQAEWVSRDVSVASVWPPTNKTRPLYLEDCCSLFLLVGGGINYFLR